MTTTVAPGGAAEAVTTFEYDDAGQITKITSPDASWLSFTYDPARRLTAVANNLGESTTFGYDAMGNATTITVRGTTIEAQRTQTFDELGRLLTAMGASGQTWRYAYDRTDNPTSIADPRSEVHAGAFDALNRLSTWTDPESGVVTLTYDAQDNVVEYTDPRTFDTAYVRNGFGDVIRRSSPDTGITDYWYDERGLLVEMVDARSVEVNFTYDDAGRRLTRTFPTSSAEDVAYSYDDTTGGNPGVGRLTGVSDESGTSAYVYDVRGNIVQETRVIDGETYVTQYTYDAADLVETVTYPSGRIVTYTRDAAGRVEEVTTQENSLATPETVAESIGWLAMARPESIGLAESLAFLLPVADESTSGFGFGLRQGPFGVSALNSDVFPGDGSVLKSLTWGNGLIAQQLLTLDGDVDWILLADPAASVPQERIVARQHDRGDGLNLTDIWDQTDHENRQTFTYSDANRLKGAVGPWGELTYDYDGVGNRLNETLDDGSVSDRDYDYDSVSNRLDEITENSSAWRSFTHDAAGNVIAEDRDGDDYTFTHNQNGRLAEIEVNSTPTASYLYDAFERLALRTTSGGTTHIITELAGNIIAEADDTGATLREYIWLDGQALAVVDDVPGTPELLFVHTDHIGRPIRMTDDTKAVVWAVEYRPFGEVESFTGTGSLDLRFPGQWFQLEAGLHYHWHRHYDPTTGRYMEPDPIGMPDGPSRWGYAGGTPLMFSDPMALAVDPFATLQLAKPADACVGPAPTPLRVAGRGRPIWRCTGIGGQECGAPMLPGGINPQYPTVCADCLIREGIWPAPGAPVPKELE